MDRLSIDRLSRAIPSMHPPPRRPRRALTSPPDAAPSPRRRWDAMGRPSQVRLPGVAMRGRHAGLSGRSRLDLKPNRSGLMDRIVGRGSTAPPPLMRTLTSIDPPRPYRRHMIAAAAAVVVPRRLGRESCGAGPEQGVAPRSSNLWIGWMGFESLAVRKATQRRSKEEISCARLSHTISSDATLH